MENNKVIYVRSSAGALADLSVERCVWLPHFYHGPAPVAFNQPKRDGCFVFRFGNVSQLFRKVPACRAELVYRVVKPLVAAALRAALAHRGPGVAGVPPNIRQHPPTVFDRTKVAALGCWRRDVQVVRWPCIVWLRVGRHVRHPDVTVFAGKPLVERDVAAEREVHRQPHV